MSDLEKLSDEVGDAVDEDGLECCGHYGRLSVMVEAGDGSRDCHCWMCRREGGEEHGIWGDVAGLRAWQLTPHITDTCQHDLLELIS